MVLHPITQLQHTVNTSTFYMAIPHDAVSNMVLW